MFFFTEVSCLSRVKIEAVGKSGQITFAYRPSCSRILRFGDLGVAEKGTLSPGFS
jgi:hypothetical protein